MTPVTTRSYNNARSGLYADRTWALTSTHVQKNGIRVVGQMKLDDPRGTEGQILALPSITMRDGLSHNVIYCADMSNNVYCFDADRYYAHWKHHIGNPIDIARYGKRWDMWGINPTWGSLATMVINLDAKVLYNVSASSPDGSMEKITYRLHSLSLVDGSDVAPPLSLDGATFHGAKGSPASKWGDAPRKQRVALTLNTYGGTTVVFVTCGSFLESSPTNVGIVVAVDVTNTHAPTISAAWATGGTKYTSSGIWMAGAGLSCDDNGDLYGMTGNGAFDPVNGYFGNSFFRLRYTPASASTPASLKCIQWWSPYSDAALAGDDPTSITPGKDAPDDMDGPTSNSHAIGDEDLGSGGPLPVLRSHTGFSKNILIGGGKHGALYPVDADNMGNTERGDFAPDKVATNWAKLAGPAWAAGYSGIGLDLMPQNLIDIPNVVGGYTRHIHGQPVYYRSPDHGVLMFVQCENAPVKAATINPDGSLTWVADGDVIASQGMAPPGGMPGGMLTLTCQQEGDNTAVLWASMPWYDNANRRIVAGRLVAYGANWINESNGQRTLIKLWDSADWGIDYKHAKFNIPTPFNNRLFVPSYDGRILVFA